MSNLESSDRFKNHENDVYVGDGSLIIKETMYKTKMENLKMQMQQLKDGVHPEYLLKKNQVEAAYEERLKLIKTLTEHLVKITEDDYENDRQAALREFEEKKNDLKESLLTDLEERRRLIEVERNSLELNSEGTETKTVMPRKLRRRANDPVPAPDKRRKVVSANFVNLLDEKDIEADYKCLAVKPPAPVARRGPRKSHPNDNDDSQMMASGSDNVGGPMIDVRIEDGKLIYEKRWFHRGQPVFVEGKDIGKCAANILQINPEAIVLKKVDGNKIRVLVPQLKYGMITLKRRVP